MHHRQILRACGASVLLCDVLVHGLANSIYSQYDPSLPSTAQTQFADVVAAQRSELARLQAELSDLREEQRAKDGEANKQLLGAALVRASSRTRSSRGV